jgi:hypothetical protein
VLGIKITQAASFSSWIFAKIGNECLVPNIAKKEKQKKTNISPEITNGVHFARTNFRRIFMHLYP